MSWEALAWAKQQRGLGAQGKLLLILLAEKTGSTHSCYPSVARLADEAEVSERTVQRLLAKFETAGLIRRTPRKRRTTVYTLLVNSITTTAMDNVVVEEDQVEMGDNLSPINGNDQVMGDRNALMGDTQTVTPWVTPRVSPEPQKNTIKNNYSVELALSDDDGMFLVQAEQLSITAQTIVGAWVDAIKENGVEPTGSQCGRVGRTAKELLEKNEPTRVLDAAIEAGRAGHAAIDSAMIMAAGKGFAPPRRQSTAKVDARTGAVLDW